MTTVTTPEPTPYQARPIKRRRRKRAQVEQLEGQIYAVLAEDWPQSVRHVFYRMTDPRLPEPVEKSDRGYNQVQDRITKMRRAGVIPYGWITDATRRGYHVATYGSAAEALRAWQGHYRGDLWSRAGVYVEVWVESRSIAGVIEDTCEELAVSLYPAGGFTSITLAHQAAEYINAATGAGEIPAHVIYIGDYDPAGVLIDRKLEEELRLHLHSGVQLHFDRIAITPEQVNALDLPTKPRKAGERRAPHVLETVEAEAMPAGLMRELLRAEIEKFLPTGALESARAAEQSERSLIGWAARLLQDGGA
jgi:hypothetical protein